MNGIEPVVRYMIPCDDVQQSGEGSRRVNIYGLVGTIRSRAEPPFPFLHSRLCVFLSVAGGRGEGEVNVRIVHADSEQVLAATPSHRVNFGPDPLSVRSLVFRLRNVTFHQPGLYLLDFCYNGKAIARQTFLVI